MAVTPPTPPGGNLGDYQQFLDYQKQENLKLQAFMVQSKAEENKKEAALQAARSATFK